MPLGERDDQDFAGEAEDALAESRRQAGEEERTIEDNPGTRDAEDSDEVNVKAL